MSAALLGMEQLVEDWARQGDRRSIFADAYGTMTSNMVAAIERGQLEDSGWVDRLLHRFAGYYIEAVDSYDSDGDCPPVWRHALDGTRNEDLHPLQHLFLGINARINYDLAFALADVLDDWNSLDTELRDEWAFSRLIAGWRDDVWP